MTLQREALQLPEVDRALLANRLISSLLKSPPKLDATWANESEDRLAAYHRGELKAIDGSTSLAELRKKFAK